ncbi:MAG: hypothetical protein ACRYF7_20690 [Janthinobacterium lividum]
MAHAYRWQPLDGIGIKHLSLKYLKDLFVADGLVIGDSDDGPFGCSYLICCDTAW